jgi:hypothetical protein
MKPEFRWGLYAGGAMSAWVLLEYALGLHTRHLALGEFTHWGTEVILCAALFFLLRHQLAGRGRSWLPVWEGVLRGGGASLVAAVFLYCFTAVYVFMIHPDWPDLVLARNVGLMRAEGVPEPVIREHARAFRWGFTPSGLAVSVIGFYSLVGVVASSLLTLWLNWRHKEPVHGR